MIDFQYGRADDIADALQLIANESGAKFVAGGTNLIDLMKMEVERPTKVIDITRLPLKQVEDTSDGGLRIGALVRNSEQRARRSNCATWPPRAATSCSARAAIISTIRRRRATNAR